MLEAVDYTAMDMEEPFLGALIDRCCGYEYEAPMTAILTKYADMVSFMLHRGLNTGWKEEELASLQSSFSRFKDEERVFFCYCQKSGMGTSKCHFLDHVVEDLR